MITILYSIKDYFLFLYSLGAVALGFSVFMVLTFITLILSDYLGYSGRILRGSRSTIKFFKDKGWVDNYNVSKFIVKSIKRYPFIVRANFNLYTCSDKPLTNYINDSCYNNRDYAIREKTIKHIYDFVLITGGIITFVHIMNIWDFVSAFKCMVTVLFAFIMRYILMGSIMFREMRAKKLYLKAIDLMANGVFLNTHTEVDNSVECLENCPAEKIRQEILSEDEEIDNSKLEALTIAVNKTH